MREEFVNVGYFDNALSKHFQGDSYPLFLAMVRYGFSQGLESLLGSDKSIDVNYIKEKEEGEDGEGDEDCDVRSDGDHASDDLDIGHTALSLAITEDCTCFDILTEHNDIDINKGYALWWAAEKDQSYML